MRPGRICYHIAPAPTVHAPGAAARRGTGALSKGRRGLRSAAIEETQDGFDIAGQVFAAGCEREAPVIVGVEQCGADGVFEVVDLPSKGVGCRGRVLERWRQCRV